MEIPDDASHQANDEEDEADTDGDRMLTHPIHQIVGGVADGDALACSLLLSSGSCGRSARAGLSFRAKVS
jgi:hypothetical protein